jgi:hypothetical protein
MNKNWHVRVTTDDGQQQEFSALAPLELTEDQKALWRTATDGRIITVARIKVAIQWCGEAVRIFTVPKNTGK